MCNRTQTGSCTAAVSLAPVTRGSPELCVWKPACTGALTGSLKSHQRAARVLHTVWGRRNTTSRLWPINSQTTSEAKQELSQRRAAILQVNSYNPCNRMEPVTGILKNSVGKTLINKTYTYNSHTRSGNPVSLDRSNWGAGPLQSHGALNRAVFHEGPEVQALLIAPSDTAVLTGCLKQGPNEEGARLDARRSLVLLPGEASAWCGTRSMRPPWPRPTQGWGTDVGQAVRGENTGLSEKLPAFTGLEIFSTLHRRCTAESQKWKLICSVT